MLEEYNSWLVQTSTSIWPMALRTRIPIALPQHVCKNGNAGPCVSSLCLPIHAYESVWHVLFDFPKAAGDTGFADRLVVDFSCVLMCVGFKATYAAEKSRHF